MDHHHGGGIGRPAGGSRQDIGAESFRIHCRRPEFPLLSDLPGASRGKNASAICSPSSTTAGTPRSTVTWTCQGIHRESFTAAPRMGYRARSRTCCRPSMWRGLHRLEDGRRYRAHLADRGKFKEMLVRVEETERVELRIGPFDTVRLRVEGESSPRGGRCGSGTRGTRFGFPSSSRPRSSSAGSTANSSVWRRAPWAVA